MYKIDTSSSGSSKARVQEAFVDHWTNLVNQSLRKQGGSQSLKFSGKTDPKGLKHWIWAR